MFWFSGSPTQLHLAMKQNIGMRRMTLEFPVLLSVVLSLHSYVQSSPILPSLVHPTIQNGFNAGYVCTSLIQKVLPSRLI